MIEKTNPPTEANGNHAGSLSHADCIYESELLFKRVRTVMENLLAFINMFNHACRHSALLLSHTHQEFSTLCHSGVQHAKSASICDSVRYVFLTLRTTTLPITP